MGDLSTDGENFGLLNITVTYEEKQKKQFEIISSCAIGTAKVSRTLDDFNILYQALPQQYADIVICPEFDTNSISDISIQQFLNILVAKLGENLFACPILLEFLDDGYGQSEILKLQSDYFFCQIRAMESQLEKLEIQNAKLFSLIQELNFRLSCSSPKGESLPIEPSSNSATLRRRSEPQLKLTAQNLHGGLGMYRRLSLKRRTSLVSNVTSISATSAVSDEQAPTFQFHGRRPSQLTESSDFEGDFEFVDDERNNNEVSPSTDVDRVNWNNGNELSTPIMNASPLMPATESSILNVSIACSPSPKIKPTNSPGPASIQTTGSPNLLKTESKENGIVQVQPVSAKPSSLARLWQVTGNMFETIMEEEEASIGDKNKTAPATASITASITAPAITSIASVNSATTIMDDSLTTGSSTSKPMNVSHGPVIDVSGASSIPNPLSPGPPGLSKPSYPATVLAIPDVISLYNTAVSDVNSATRSTANEANSATRSTANVTFQPSTTTTSSRRNSNSSSNSTDSATSMQDASEVTGAGGNSNSNSVSGDGSVDSPSSFAKLPFKMMRADQLNDSCRPLYRDDDFGEDYSSTKPFFSGSLLVEYDLIPTNILPTAVDDDIVELLSLIQPHPEQIAHRGSMHALIVRWLRRILGVRALDCGLTGFRAFLPDDGMKLGLFLPGSSKASSTWPTMFCDKLIRLSDGMDPLILEEFDEIRIPPCFHDPTMLPLLIDHMITAVSAHNPHQHLHSESSPMSTDTPAIPNASESRALVTLDSVQIEIVANPRVDLALSTLFEEVSVLVGKDHLFKRSLLIIRAWWAYETTAYVGSPIKHYLPDFALSVMVCALFNQYHRIIHHPLQALAIFLAEYSHIHWESQCVTLQGIVSFEADNGCENGPCINQPNDKHLLSAFSIQKYRDLLQCSGLDSATSSPSCFGTMRQPSQVLDGPFERGAINIVNPITGRNMVQKDYINPKRHGRISKAFETGAKTLNLTLKLATKGSLGSQNQINSFFRGICSRFGTGWRPDVLANTTVMSINLIKQRGRFNKGSKEQDVTDEVTRFKETLRSILESSWDNLWTQLHYANLLMDGKVTDQAVIYFCKDVLQDRGALPVGEVGKILQDTTAAIQLSTKLKEKYGGLKKFLEMYESEFIMSLEHPFNPHVLIRHGLTPDELESLSKNVIPPMYSFKNKKLMFFQARKLRANHGMMGPGGDPNWPNFPDQAGFMPHGNATMPRGAPPMQHNQQFRNGGHPGEPFGFHQNPNNFMGNDNNRGGQFGGRDGGPGKFRGNSRDGFGGPPNGRFDRGHAPFLDGGMPMDPRDQRVGMHDSPYHMDPRFDRGMQEPPFDQRFDHGLHERNRGGNMHDNRFDRGPPPPQQPSQRFREPFVPHDGMMHEGDPFYPGFHQGHGNPDGRFDRDAGKFRGHRMDEFPHSMPPGGSRMEFGLNSGLPGGRQPQQNSSLNPNAATRFTQLNRGPPVPVRSQQFPIPPQEKDLMGTRNAPISNVRRPSLPITHNSNQATQFKGQAFGHDSDNLMMHPLLSPKNNHMGGGTGFPMPPSSPSSHPAQQPVTGLHSGLAGADVLLGHHKNPEAGIFSNTTLLGAGDGISTSDDASLRLGESLLPLSSNTSTNASSTTTSTVGRLNRTEDAALLDHILGNSLNDNNFDFGMFKY